MTNRPMAKAKVAEPKRMLNQKCRQTLMMNMIQMMMRQGLLLAPTWHLLGTYLAYLAGHQSGDEVTYPKFPKSCKSNI